MNKANIQMISSVILLLLCFTFLLTVCRYVPPLGDDILLQYDNVYQYYDTDIDGMNPDYVVGNRIDNIGTYIDTLVNNYTRWTGRLTGLLFIPILTIGGELATAVFQAAVITAFVLMGCALIFGSLKETLKHPVVLLCAFLIFVFYSIAVPTTLLITFTSMYTLTILIYFLYIYIHDKLLANNYSGTAKSIIFFNILGVFAGFTHELIGAIFIMMIGLRILYVWLCLKRVKFLAIVKHHIGLAIGFILCVVAPGNFVRLNGGHDSGIFAPYTDKIYDSIVMHISTFKTYSPIGLLLQLVIALLFVISIIVLIKNKRFIDWLKNNYEYIVAFVASPVLWAVVSYVPAYGVNGWAALLLIMEIRCIYSAVLTIDFTKLSFVKPLYTLGSVGALLACLALIVIQLPWMGDLIQTTTQRESLIATAVEAGELTVEVPAYPPTTNNKFTLANYNNEPDEFKTSYYIEYYGTELIIVE